MGFLIALLFFIALVSLYIVSYLLNKKTEAPIKVDVAACKACKSIGCANNPAHNEERE